MGHVCPEGHFCGGTNEPKTECAAGTAAKNTGSVSCLDCSPGQYATVLGSSTCGYCGTNQFAENEAQTICDLCPMSRKKKKELQSEYKNTKVDSMNAKHEDRHIGQGWWEKYDPVSQHLYYASTTGQPTTWEWPAEVPKEIALPKEIDFESTATTKTAEELNPLPSGLDAYLVAKNTKPQRKQQTSLNSTNTLNGNVRVIVPRRRRSHAAHKDQEQGHAEL